MARAGSLWVEGNDLHYIASNGTDEYAIVGTSVGANTGREGSLWVESGQLHWINEAGTTEYRTDESVLTAASYRIGSLWIDTASLRWVDENGDIRKYEGATCDSGYNLTAVATTKGVSAICETAGQCTPSSGDRYDSDHTPDGGGNPCAGEHLQVLKSIRGGGYTNVYDGRACTTTAKQTWNPSPTEFSGCTGTSGNCDVSCFGQWYQFRMCRHEDGTHEDCSDCETGNRMPSSGSYDTCECQDCKVGGGNGP
jgi:hypothetical protein